MHRASMLQARMTMARTMKLYKLSEETATPGIRPMQREDVPQVGGSLVQAAGSRNRSHGVVFARRLATLGQQPASHTPTCHGRTSLSD